MMKLQTIDENLMYRVLSTPTFTRKEHLVVDFLAEYVQMKGYEGGIDDKGNVYICKGKLSEGEYYPCVTAHMDTVHHEQIPFIEAGKPIPLVTKKVNGKHYIHAKGFGLGGDDKSGIVVALSIVDKLPACKAVFFVEEEVGCVGSREAELEWFNDVGYIMAFDAPGFNCASRSCNGVPLFNNFFYDTYLTELGEKFGLTKFEAHPYTDIMVLRNATSLTCMNFGAGYHGYHTSGEYCIAEEIDQAATMGLYLVEQMGFNEYRYGTLDWPDDSKQWLPELSEELDYLENHPDRSVAISMEVVIQIGHLWEEGFREITPKMKKYFYHALQTLKSCETKTGQINSLIKNGTYYYRNMDELRMHSMDNADYILFPLFN